MRVMIACGEPSGDLYAGALASELRTRQPDIDVFGMGGERLRAAGADLVAHYHGISVTGLTEALSVVPRSLRLLRTLTEAARRRRPAVFIAGDFPDFNFRLMARMAGLGIPVVYYISPQLWAWRSGRMATMRKHVSKVLVIFPFEQAIYERAGVPVEFVGHPLVEMARTAVAGHDRAGFLGGLGLTPAAPTVALLPGSRRNELARHVPVLAESLPLMATAQPGVQFVVARAPHMPEDALARMVRAAGACQRPLAIVADRTDDALAFSDVAVTASGTATVQCAIHERPMVVIYKLSALTYALGKPLARVDMYAMPNLVAGARIVPELIQDGCTAEAVAKETVALLADPTRHTRMRHALGSVRDRLHVPGASARAAEAVIGIAGSRRL
jgi:lipid-A-disaccharide synthase